MQSNNTEREALANELMLISDGGNLGFAFDIHKLSDFIIGRQVDELKRAANHNNSEYTSDYLEGRIAELQSQLPKKERME